MGTTRHSVNSKNATKPIKVDHTVKPANAINKNITCDVPLITTSSNLTSDYIGNITKDNKGSMYNQPKKYKKKKHKQNQITTKLRP